MTERQSLSTSMLIDLGDDVDIPTPRGFMSYDTDEGQDSLILFLKENLNPSSLYSQFGRRREMEHEPSLDGYREAKRPRKYEDEDNIRNLLDDGLSQYEEKKADEDDGEDEDSSEVGIVTILVRHNKIPIMKMEVSSDTNLADVATYIWDRYAGVIIRPGHSLDTCVWNFGWETSHYDKNDLLAERTVDTIPLEREFWFVYDFGNPVTFALEVEYTDIVDIHPAEMQITYPRISTLIDNCSIEEANFTREETIISQQYRLKKENAHETEYSVNQRCVIPLIEPYSIDEIGVMITFLESGVKFTKAWNSYLQHAFLGRSKGATSGKWYSLKKHHFPESSPPAMKNEDEHKVIEGFMLVKWLRQKVLKKPFKYAKWHNADEYLKFSTRGASQAFWPPDDDASDPISS